MGDYAPESVASFPWMLNAQFENPSRRLVAKIRKPQGGKFNFFPLETFRNDDFGNQHGRYFSKWQTDKGVMIMKIMTQYKICAILIIKNCARIMLRRAGRASAHHHRELLWGWRSGMPTTSDQSFWEKKQPCPTLATKCLWGLFGVSPRWGVDG